ncbi:MAG: META domain-containing protein, partial [Ignavibacteriaceae bacterium]|nr:META domain-containing protein [Ignavibacteriaceae bacterium]
VTNMKISLFVSVFIITVFMGCSNSNVSTDHVDKNDLQLTGKYFKLIELMGKPVKMSENQQKETHIIFKEEESRVNGFGSCNTFFGSFEIKAGNRISFSNITSTLKACPDMEIETEFFKILELTLNYNFDGKYLQLNREKMATLAKFEVIWFE